MKFDSPSGPSSLGNLESAQCRVVIDQTVLRRNVYFLRVVPCRRKEHWSHDFLFQRKLAPPEWGVGGDQRSFWGGRSPYREREGETRTEWVERSVGVTTGRCQCTQKILGRKTCALCLSWMEDPEHLAASQKIREVVPCEAWLFMDVPEHTKAKLGDFAFVLPLQEVIHSLKSR